MPITRSSGVVIVNHVSKFGNWAHQHDDIHRGKEIGKGNFSNIYEGTLLTSGTKVAIKMCRAELDMYRVDQFLQRAEIMKERNHPNIVKLFGICYEREPVCIVMELMPGGPFLTFLQKKGMHQTKTKLCQMCVDIARGMEYLESKNYIHGALTAKNSLVGDNDIVKITNFWLDPDKDRCVYLYSSKGMRKFPFKWAAPEVSWDKVVRSINFIVFVCLLTSPQTTRF